MNSTRALLINNAIQCYHRNKQIENADLFNNNDARIYNKPNNDTHSIKSGFDDYTLWFWMNQTYNKIMSLMTPALTQEHVAIKPTNTPNSDSDRLWNS